MTQATTASTIIGNASCVSNFAERQAEKFPLNTFFSLQTFRPFYASVDYIGGIL